MGVAEKDGSLDGRLQLRHHLDRERADAGSAIEDEPQARVGDEFYTRSIAAVAQGCGARCGDRSSCAPEANPHAKSPTGTPLSRAQERPPVRLLSCEWYP